MSAVVRQSLNYQVRRWLGTYPALPLQFSPINRYTMLSKSDTPLFYRSQGCDLPMYDHLSSERLVFIGQLTCEHDGSVIMDIEIVFALDSRW